MTTNTIRLPLFEAMQACAAVLPHTSADDVTPVITTASIEGDTITATDRYSVGQFKLSRSLDSGSIMLPREAVKWIARFVVKHLLSYVPRTTLTGYEVRIDGPDPVKSPRPAIENVLVSVVSEVHGVEASRMFHPVLGNFPPVGRLLAGHKPAEAIPTVALGPYHVEKFTTYARKWHRDEPLRFTLSESDNPGKPGPVLIELGRFTGMLQPNLLIR